MMVYYSFVKAKKKLKLLGTENTFICNECVQAQELFVRELAEEVWPDLSEVLGTRPTPKHFEPLMIGQDHSANVPLASSCI